MKRIFNYVIFFLICFACQDIIDPSLKPINDEEGDYVISVNIGETTKADIDGTSIKWGSRDKIYVGEINASGNYKDAIRTYNIDVNTISEDGKNAEFIGPNLNPGGRYFAVAGCESPAEVLKPGNWISDKFAGYMVFTGFYSQQHANNSDDLLERNWTMIASPFEVKDDLMPKLSFRNILSYFKLNLKLDDLVQDSYELKNIEVKSTEDVFGNSIILANAKGELQPYYWSNKRALSLYYNSVISKDKDYTVFIPFYPNEDPEVQSSDLSVTIQTLDNKQSTVVIPGKSLKSNMLYAKDLVFSEPKDYTKTDSLALVAIYEQTGGANWTKNTNWLSDVPYSEWEGVSVKYNGRVAYLYLYSNNLDGDLPKEISQLTELEVLYMSDNNLRGSLPPEYGNLSSLRTMVLSDNNIEGALPREWAQLKGINDLYLTGNRLSGEIPVEFTSHTRWNKLVWSIMSQQPGYGFISVPDVYLQPVTITTIDNQIIHTDEFFAGHKINLLLHWRTWCGYSTHYLSEIIDLYNSYNSEDFGLLTSNDEELDVISNYVSSNAVPGKVFRVYDDNRVPYVPTNGSPSIVFVDQTGKVVYSEEFEPVSSWQERGPIAKKILEEYLGESESEEYESTDYSKDGEVITLQRASVGNGINLVIVGDGFVDKDMHSGGLYEQRMNEAMEYYFSEEPNKTFRNRYNVYLVKAVSKNMKATGDNETVFSTWFGDGTSVGGDDNKIFQYALNVPSITSINDLTVINVLNTARYAGTCYMYFDSEASISYCPITGWSEQGFREVVLHETGHGFAKLLDEYAYAGGITESEKNSFLRQKDLGWGANVDITDDPKTIQWSHFLTYSRYEGLVGIYEGALTFEKGAWRPTEFSIMRYNTGGFNAPSRESIFNRIMELSGESTSYSKFVDYDVINLTPEVQQMRRAQSRNVDKSSFVPLSPPVVVFDSPKFTK